jgi:hypothetical protein
MSNCFSDHYLEARDKFLAAARDAGAELSHFALGHKGPEGSELFTDAAWLGHRDAKSVIVTISGTHGVEGFFGSATQVEWLWRAKGAPFPKDVAALHIHALNPYGFAWLRRTNEGNVDINRNWMDFANPLPASPLYDELSDDPVSIGLVRAIASANGRENRGMDRTTRGTDVSTSRVGRPMDAPRWSLLWRYRAHVVASNLGGDPHLQSRQRLTRRHSGLSHRLGPYGYAEPIIGWRRSDPGFARTRAWIGATGKSFYGDDRSPPRSRAIA